MEMQEIKLAQTLKSWQGNDESKDVKTITFCVTEDCNLACKYCYMTGKNNKNKMDFDLAKRCVDYILSNREIFYEKSVVWDFIGGEPFLEMDLIDKLCDYIKLQMFLLNHPWFDSYRFSFSSNGLLYHTEKVQRFIEKNKTHISIGISVDGNKLKHDLQRVYPNGKGSYEDVMKNVSLWQTQFINGSTKATFSHDDLPHLKDSIISLWDNGIKEVAANVIFEDVWQDGDDEILERQLDELGDYILNNQKWNDYYVRFFDPTIGNPISEEDKKHNFCGAGKMLAIDCNGNFYPCIRFLDFSMSKRKGRSIGNINNGFDENKLRAFKCLTLEDQSKPECLNCEVATGCALCTGFNYDDSGSIFDRATHICKLHKATVRANKRFWAKYERLTGNKSPRRDYESVDNKMYLQIITDDNITPHCNYKNWNDTKNTMSKKMLKKGIDFAMQNGFEIVFLGESPNIYDLKTNNDILIVNSNFSNYHDKDNVITIHDNRIEELNSKSDNSILLVNGDNIDKLSVFVEQLAKCNSRINIKLKEIDEWNQETIDNYKIQLDKLIDIIEETYLDSRPIEINVLTDRLNYNKHCSCTAGTKTYTLAPNGRFYICPAFYFDNPEQSVGDLESGISNVYERLMKIDNAPICKQCDAYQCSICKYLNKKKTEEYNIPSKIQCIISNCEKNKSKELQTRLISRGLIENKNIIQYSHYIDPLESFLEKIL